MNEIEIKTGDKFDTEAFGEVVVVDIFTSSSTKRIVFEVKAEEDEQRYLAYLGDLGEFIQC